MWSTGELIVAPATPAGAGGRGVVRIAGDGLAPLLRCLFQAAEGDFAAGGRSPQVVAATLSPAGLAAEWGAVPVEILHWPGPIGPIGGPLAEVQLPASAGLIDAVVAEACRHGARPARGGEFSLRAFLAGRLDLLQAEAVLAVVEANTPVELSAALDALAGGVGRQLESLRETLLDLAADVEAAIDFADETTPDAVPAADAAARSVVERRLREVVDSLERVALRLAGRDANATGGVPRVVLAGPPNVGKSSLFNRLVGRDAALVADEPGTTRDWIAVRLDASAGEPACLLVDIAGVASAGGVLANDDVGRNADVLARAEIARADVVVACRDACHAAVSPVPSPSSAVRIDVLTRCDRGEHPSDAAAAIRTSSRWGLGISTLRMAILDAVANLPGGRTPATTRMRAALSAAQAALSAALRSVGETGDGRPGDASDEAVVAALVLRAVAVIDEVTGREIGTDLVDRIFSRHCIGK